MNMRRTTRWVMWGSCVFANSFAWGGPDATPPASAAASGTANAAVSAPTIISAHAAANAAASTPASTPANAAAGQSARQSASLPKAPEAAADSATGAQLNNLAVLAVRGGDAAAATKYFEQAIAANDEHKGFYALNYAKFLQPRDKQGAAAAARIAVAAAPDSRVALRQLGEALWQANPAEMLPLALQLVDQGRADIATEFALRCLRSQKRPATERRGWLILLASRLGTEYGLSQTVRDTMAADLATLAADSEVGRGSQQLRAVIAAPPQGRADIDWWAGQDTVAAPSRKSGREAMRDVLLAAGEDHVTQPGLAEKYFSAAVDLGDRGPDPDAFLRLVELHATANASAKLAALMERYQWELFSEKAEAYARQDWALIYRLHVALGMTYAHLKVWRSSTEFQNAVFQLSHAMRAADELNRQAKGQGRLTRIAVPARAVRALADGYRATGSPERSAQTLLAGAVSLRDAGYVGDSREVVAAIGSNELKTIDAAGQRTYGQLREGQLHEAEAERRYTEQKLRDAN